MIRLDITEIDKIAIRKNFSRNSPPRKFNSEEELIEWLRYDLKEQAIYKGQIPDKNNIIVIEDDEEKNYSLNICLYFNNDCEIQINFEFNIFNIICNLREELYNRNFKFGNIQLFSIHGLNFQQDRNNKDINFRLYFKNVIFTKELDLTFINFNNELYFLECTFQENLSFKNSDLKEKCEFQSNIFEKEINFSEALIYKQLLLIKSKLLSIVVEKNYNETGLKSSNVSENLYSKMIFDNLKFNNINSKLYIDGMTYRKNRELSFQDININGFIELRNIEVKEANFKGSFINGGVVNPVNFKLQNFSNRESALFLKQWAIANHNYIDALQYHALEVVEHKKELSQKTNKKLKDYGDIVSINLSSLFSDNGVNWIKALGMTILSTLVLFTIFYFPDLPTIMRMIYRNDYSLLYYYFSKDFFEDFIRYIIPTEYDLVFNYAKNYKSTNFFKFLIKICGVITYFTGKIAFWYGSFHTVSAFRKFNRSL